MEEETENIKPISEKTKWMIAIVLICVFAVLEYVIFQLGVGQGFSEGRKVPPLHIIEQSDEKAMATLASFMADSAAGKEGLVKLLVNRDERLAWVRDASLRSDVTWGLARELAIEGDDRLSSEIVAQLISEGYSRGEYEKWAQRAQLFSELMSSRGNHVKAAEFADHAYKGYQSVQSVEGQTFSLEMLSSSLIELNRFDDAMKALESLRKLNESDKKATMTTLATMGVVSRLQGSQDEARKRFAAVLALIPEGVQTEDKEDVVGSARIAMAEAFMETGNMKQAEKMFKSGLNLLDGKTTDLSFTLSAMRGLAEIEQSKKQYQEAIGYLYQAEGAAKGRVPANNPFWFCLYDQRGWILLESGAREQAIKDFARVTNRAEQGGPLAQSCEGIGVAYTEMGQADLAYKNLLRAKEIREKLFPGDFSALARVYKRLGTACDLLGRSEESLEYYGKATAAIEQHGLDKNTPLYIEALLCKSHTLTELEKWQEAVDSFNAVIPLLSGEAKVETLKQLANCYDKLGLTAKGDECWQQAGYPRVRSGKAGR